MRAAVLVTVALAAFVVLSPVIRTVRSSPEMVRS
jgi:hypothetical protein